MGGKKDIKHAEINGTVLLLQLHDCPQFEIQLVCETLEGCHLNLGIVFHLITHIHYFTPIDFRKLKLTSSNSRLCVDIKTPV